MTPTPFVTDEGDGEPVVMLHGLGGTTSMYQPQAGALAGSYRVIRIDLPGCGRSPFSADGLSVPGWSDAVVGVLDALGVAAATVVVHSLSTLVAADIAARHPARLRSLVALGPVRAQPDPVKAATRERARIVRESGMGQIVDGVLAMAVSERARRDQPVVGAFVRESVLAQEPAGYAAACEALADAAEPDWASVRVPTRLVGGDDDRLATPELVATIAGLLPDATHEIVPGAGHWLSIEEPELITEIVRKAVRVA